MPTWQPVFWNRWEVYLGTSLGKGQIEKNSFPNTNMTNGFLCLSSSFFLSSFLCVCVFLSSSLSVYSLFPSFFFLPFPFLYLSHYKYTCLTSSIFPPSRHINILSVTFSQLSISSYKYTSQHSRSVSLSLSFCISVSVSLSLTLFHSVSDSLSLCL